MITFFIIFDLFISVIIIYPFTMALKMKVEYTIPISILATIGFLAYSYDLYHSGHRIFNQTTTTETPFDKSLEQFFLNQNDIEITKKIVSGKTVLYERGTGVFTDLNMDGILFVRKNNNIYIGLGAKGAPGHVVMKDMNYFVDVENVLSEYVAHVKETGFGKILHRGKEVHLYYGIGEDEKQEVRKIAFSDKFTDLCDTLQLVS